MTCFEIMKCVLDLTALDVFGTTQLSEEQGKAVTEHFDRMSRTLNAGGAPDYSDPYCRFAYVYCYPAAHAHLFESACDASADTRQLVASKIKSGDMLRVCFVGAGPGTELVGLGKFLSRRVAENEAIVVNATFLDRQDAWRENILRTVEGVNQKLANDNVVFVTDIVIADFCSAREAIPEVVLGHDLYAFNYSISETPRSDDLLKGVMTKLAASLPKGGQVIIADREEKQLVQRACSLLEAAGLQITEQRTGVRFMNTSEDCGEIKQAYYDRIKRRPRVQFGKQGMDQGAFWVIGTKRPTQ